MYGTSMRISTFPNRLIYAMRNAYTNIVYLLINISIIASAMPHIHLVRRMTKQFHIFHSKSVTNTQPTESNNIWLRKVYCHCIKILHGKYKWQRGFSSKFTIFQLNILSKFFYSAKPFFPLRKYFLWNHSVVEHIV